jgi:DNA-directed RNA polymerase subunit RPC12/RpoP
MRIICSNCGEEITVPNHKNKAHKSSDKNHSIVLCRQCGHRNFVDTVSRYNGKREEYTGEASDFR